jgi:CBS domain containing-hemolysin-like protein
MRMKNGTLANLRSCSKSMDQTGEETSLLIRQVQSGDRQAFWTRPAVRILLAVSAFALVLAGLFIFVNMKPLANAAIRIFNVLAAAFRPLANQFQQLFARLSSNAKLFILGGFGLLGAAFLDYILQQQTLRRSR